MTDLSDKKNPSKTDLEREINNLKQKLGELNQTKKDKSDKFKKLDEENLKTRWHLEKSEKKLKPEQTQNKILNEICKNHFVDGKVDIPASIEIIKKDPKDDKTNNNQGLLILDPPREKKYTATWSIDFPEVEISGIDYSKIFHEKPEEKEIDSILNNSTDTENTSENKKPAGEVDPLDGIWNDYDGTGF